MHDPHDMLDSAFLKEFDHICASSEDHLNKGEAVFIAKVAGEQKTSYTKLDANVHVTLGMKSQSTGYQCHG